MTDQPLIVLDASALIAFLHREPGGDVVELVLSQAVMSTVNWCEVARKLVERGRSTEATRADLEELGLGIVPFTAEDAEASAEMYKVTCSSGLSLGDRACLALARRLAAPALTADRRWANVPVGVEVRLIR